MKLLAKRWFEVTLLGIWVAAILIRWYGLPEHLFFGFEQGRDALASMAIARFEDPVLVGPKTDIGGVFHGAWYYYLMAVPYGVSGGNPLVASFFLVVLTSLAPLVVADIVRRMTMSKPWAVVAGLLAVTSYEAIHYSRWLSNVTPAVLLVPLVFWLLWRYRQSHQQRYWYAACATAGLSAQFEVIQTLWWLVAFGWLWLRGWIPRGQWRVLVGSVIAAGWWFLPMLLFNIRNQWITLHALLGYMTPQPDAASPTLWARVARYGYMLWRVAELNLRERSVPALGLILGAGVGGWLLQLGSLVRLPRRSAEETAQLAAVELAGVWWLMTLPVLLFHKSIDLLQLYVGTGLGLIVLLVLGLHWWWQRRSWWPKLLVVAVWACVVAGWPAHWYELQTNQNVFYRSVQDDLNLADQYRLLDELHQQHQQQSFRWQAFTIPYFQSEAWRYLYGYRYPQDASLSTADQPRFLFLIVEEKVDPYWRQRWTQEAGDTTADSEQQIGRITLERRLFGEAPNN